jgi:transcriptional regulator with XRE-family HTH domain
VTKYERQFWKDVGITIRSVREEEQMSQAALAIDAGVLRGQIAQWEQGRRVISLLQASVLAGALGISVEHLISGEP